MPHHGRIRIVRRPGNGGQRRTRQSFACPALPAPRLRPAYGIKSRRRRQPHPDGSHPEQQPFASGAERDSRPDRKGTTTDHLGRKQCLHLGRETLLHASLAGPGTHGRLWHYPGRHQERHGQRERGTSFGKH